VNEPYPKTQNKTYTISSIEGVNSNSCLIKIGQQSYRALIDSGAEVCLIHKRVIDQLKIHSKIGSNTINLQSVSGGNISVLGCVP